MLSPRAAAVLLAMVREARKLREGAEEYDEELGDAS
jgi:hypothetical protein